MSSRYFFNNFHSPDLQTCAPSNLPSNLSFVAGSTAMAVAQLQLNQDRWWRSNTNDFRAFPSLKNVHGESITPRPIATPRAPEMLGRSGESMSSQRSGSNMVRSRLENCRGVEGLHAALSKIAKKGRGDLVELAGAGAPAALQATTAYTPRGTCQEDEGGTYMGRQWVHPDMTFHEYRRDIDKHLRLVKARPVVDLSRSVPTLAAMGWAPPPLTRHEQNRLEESQKGATRVLPSAPSSSSSSMGRSVYSQLSNVSKTAKGITNTIR